VSSTIPQRTCSIPGCYRTHQAKGYCQTHYERMRTGQEMTAPVKAKRPHGAGSLTRYGYWTVVIDGKRQFQHVRIAEKALGRPLPEGAEVHHVNEVRTDNRNENLVICPSSSYHKLLHVRLEAQKACGNADWLKCSYCKTYDQPETMYVRSNGIRAIHHACKRVVNHANYLARTNRKGK
jgi:hypothetical protein